MEKENLAAELSVSVDDVFPRKSKGVTMRARTPENNRSTKKRITVREASNITGYHPQTLYRFGREGLITKHKTRSGRVYFYEEDIEDFMNPQENIALDVRRKAAEMVAGQPGIRHNAPGNFQSHRMKGGSDV